MAWRRSQKQCRYLQVPKCVQTWVDKLVSNEQGSLRYLAYGHCQQADLLSASLRDAGYEKIWAAFISLAQRSYWTRVWVIQELRLANRTRVFAGNSHLTDGGLILGTLGWALAWYGRSSLTDEQRARIWEDPMLRLIALFGDKHKATISELVFRYLQSECTIVHDKIYGLLGMACDAETIDVGYNISLQRLFIQICQGQPFHRGRKLRDLFHHLELGSHSFTSEDAAMDRWTKAFFHSCYSDIPASLRLQYYPPRGRSWCLRSWRRSVYFPLTTPPLFSLFILPLLLGSF